MNVECNFFGPLRESIGQKTVEREVPDGATVRDLLENLATDYEAIEAEVLDGDEVLSSVNVTVNGENVRQLDGAATELADGDVVRFAPPVVGGAK